MAKIAFVTLMPSFLEGLLPALKEAGHEYKIYAPTVNEKRNIWELNVLCNWSDLIFFEFCQQPMDQVVDFVPEDKPMLARLWRIEIFNPQFLHKVKWSNINKLYVPTEVVRDRFLKIQDKKLKPKNITVFKGPHIDQNQFTFKVREYSEKVKLCIVGNMIPRKRAFDACQLLFELPPEFSLSIIGDLKDREYATHIKEYCKDTKITDRVQIYQKIPHEAMPDVFWDHDVVLGLSTDEGNHYSIAEAMSCGTVPIMSYWPGCRELYPDWAIHPGLSSLFKSIWDWSGHPADQKKMRSLASYQWARKHFDNYQEHQMILQDIERFTNGSLR